MARESEMTTLFIGIYGFVAGVLTTGAALLAFVALCGVGYKGHTEFERKYHEAQGWGKGEAEEQAAAEEQLMTLGHRVSEVRSHCDALSDDVVLPRIHSSSNGLA